MKIIFKEKLVIILILMGLIPLLTTNFFQLHLFSLNLKEVAFNNLDKISKISSIKVEDFINQSLSNAEVVFDNEVLTSKETSEDEKIKEINKIGNYYDQFEEITVLDKNKQVVASNVKNHQQWEKNEWLIKAGNQKEKTISDIYLDPEKRERKMAFISPVLDNEEEIKYFIAIQSDVSSFFNLLDYKIGERGGIIVTDNQREIIFYSNKDLIFRETLFPLVQFLGNVLEGKDKNTYFEFFGEKQMAGFEIIENPDLNFDLYLIAHQPEGEVLGMLTEMNRITLAFSLFFLAVILAIALFLSRRISEPIKKLSLASKEITKGKFDTQLDIRSKDEFGQLAETFNEMTEKLKKSKEKLEEEKQVLEIKVQARTRELENVNKELEEKVQERTREMEEKIKELEKMNKLMTGRELKMIELKEKLKKYEKKSNKE